MLDPLIGEAEEDLSSSSNKRSVSLVLKLLVAVSLLFFLLCGGLFVGLLFPAISNARLAAKSTSVLANLRMIGIAFHEYHAVNQQLPMPFLSHAGKEIQRWASWRVTLLPHLDESSSSWESNHAQISDSAADRLLQEKCPSVYRKLIGQHREAVSDETGVFVVEHPDGVMSGTRPVSFDEVTDGLKDTILAVVVTTRSVVWTEPKELNLQQLHTAFESITPSHPLFVLFCDGSVKEFREPVAPSVVTAMVTMASDD